MATITHKRGDTLEWVITLTDNEVAVDITSWTIRSQIRQGSTLTQALTITKTNAANGIFNITATAAQTSSWSVGSHSVDIEFSDASSVVFSTETFTLRLLEDISRD